jgi:uncharacterized membrane protein
VNLFFSEQSKEFAVIATAALPIIELRGAIPFGIALGLTPTYTFILSLFGSMIPVPLLIWLIRPVFAYMRRTEFLCKMVDKICSRSLAKSDSVQKYGFWGLVIFVGIPLPGTGVWSGALVATLLEMPVKLAFPAIFIGNLIAGIAVMILSYGAFSLVN